MKRTRSFQTTLINELGMNLLCGFNLLCTAVTTTTQVDFVAVFIRKRVIEHTSHSYIYLVPTRRKAHASSD